MNKILVKIGWKNIHGKWKYDEIFLDMMVLFATILAAGIVLKAIDVWH